MDTLYSAIHIGVRFLASIDCTIYLWIVVLFMQTSDNKQSVLRVRRDIICQARTISYLRRTSAMTAEIFRARTLIISFSISHC